MPKLCSPYQSLHTFPARQVARGDRVPPLHVRERRVEPGVRGV